MDGVEYDALSVIYQNSCKGTTKNEHLQQNRAKVYFQVRFCYKWAALCDRSFGGIAQTSNFFVFEVWATFRERSFEKGSA